MISRVSLALVSSESPGAFLISVASWMPAAVVGQVCFSTTAARFVPRWCDSLVLVTPWEPASSRRRPPSGRELLEPFGRPSDLDLEKRRGILALIGRGLDRLTVGDVRGVEALHRRAKGRHATGICRRAVERLGRESIRRAEPVEQL